MREPQMSACRAVLEAKRSTLIRSLEQTRATVWCDREANSVPREAVSQQSEAAMQSLMRESRLLWIVETALQGIRDGLYGKCLFCQHEIPSKRLTAVPWAAYCASCEKLAEAYVNRPGQ
jgi:DnaK suppressor protein